MRPRQDQRLDFIALRNDNPGNGQPNIRRRLGWKLAIEDFSLGIQPVLLGMPLTATTLEI